MITSRGFAAPLAIAAGAALSACSSTPPVQSVPARGSPPPPTVSSPLPADSVPDAIPRAEPRSHNGNPPFYDVFGKRYYVLSSSVGYWERGVASWYGPGFHKERTSTGEPYDMYGMTAAHKTLPLPAYVRVTNLQNGRSVVVRVNDRGPFVGNRIIDLSYTAAAKLDMLRNGTAMVEIRTIDASAPPPVIMAAVPVAPVITPAGAAVPVTTAPVALPDPAAGATVPAPAATAAASLFVQAGAFADPANAERLAQRLRSSGSFDHVFVRDDQIAGRRIYRVRIGPVPDVAEFDRVVAALEQAGVNDAHLALD